MIVHSHCVQIGEKIFSVVLDMVRRKHTLNNHEWLHTYVMGPQLGVEIASSSKKKQLGL